MASLASEQKNETGIMEHKGSFLSQQQNLATYLCLPRPPKSKAFLFPQEETFPLLSGPPVHPLTPVSSPRSSLLYLSRWPFHVTKDTHNCIQT